MSRSDNKEASVKAVDGNNVAIAKHFGQVRRAPISDAEARRKAAQIAADLGKNKTFLTAQHLVTIDTPIADRPVLTDEQALAIVYPCEKPLTPAEIEMKETAEDLVAIAIAEAMDSGIFDAKGRRRRPTTVLSKYELGFDS